MVDTGDDRLSQRVVTSGQRMTADVRLNSIGAELLAQLRGQLGRMSETHAGVSGREPAGDLRALDALDRVRDGEVQGDGPQASV